LVLLRHIFKQLGTYHLVLVESLVVFIHSHSHEAFSEVSCKLIVFLNQSE
jgi:hypothetical protein